MTNTKQRILAGAVMALVAGCAATLQYFGIPAVRWLAILTVAAMAAEVMRAIYKSKFKNNIYIYASCVAVFAIMLGAAWVVGGRPWIILLLLLIIVAADIGAWFFGKLFGGDKMWERLSAGKTWAGQIAGIICGAAAAILYGLLGTDTFMPQLLWIGISVALLSQYGDLTASWIKRKLGLKDFGTIIPGHGGIADRFDGWIYVLPLVWLVMI